MLKNKSEIFHAALDLRYFSITQAVLRFDAREYITHNLYTNIFIGRIVN